MEKEIINKKLQENEKTWNLVADQFKEASSLPVWGPFGVGDNLNLIPIIKNKKFLEIGCGSGRSIKYLVKKGVKKVYGLDMSSAQLKEAKKFNKKAIEKKKVSLIKVNMEDKIIIEPIDIIFSVYAIGWTVNPKSTFKNIYSYLKHGGEFIWSWDHSFFTNIEYENGKFIVNDSYHKEKYFILKNWRKDGACKVPLS